MIETKNLLKKMITIASEGNPNLKVYNYEIDNMTDEEAEKFLSDTINVILDKADPGMLGNIYSNIAMKKYPK